MIYTTAAESVAEIVLRPHDCGQNCPCREIRRVPAVSEEIRKLHVQKLQSKATKVS